MHYAASASKLDVLAYLAENGGQAQVNAKDNVKKENYMFLVYILHVRILLALPFSRICIFDISLRNFIYTHTHIYICCCAAFRHR